MVWQKGAKCISVMDYTKQDITLIMDKKKSTLSDNRLKHNVEESFDMEEVQRKRKVSAHVSLRGPRRLT